MTADEAKAKVLAKWPDAFSHYYATPGTEWAWIVDSRSKHIIVGHGATEGEAWISAANGEGVADGKA